MQPLEQRSQFPAIGRREDEIKSWRQWLEATVSENPILRPALYLYDESKIKLLSENFHNQQLMRALYASRIGLEEINLINSFPGMMTIRVIGIRRLADVGSPISLKWDEEVSRFITSEGYVPFPDFLDPVHLSKVKHERINRGAITYNTNGRQQSTLIQDLEMKVVGIRDAGSNDCQVLTLINQTALYDPSSGEMLILSSEMYGVPQKPFVGQLRVAEPNILRRVEDTVNIGKPVMQFYDNPKNELISQDGSDFLEIVIQ